MTWTHVRLAIAMQIGLSGVSWARDESGVSLPSISAAKSVQGILVHEVKSSMQRGMTHIRVLLPDNLEAAKRYPVIYVLPVEAGLENRYGDGLAEVQRQGLHNRLRAIFVAPTFAHLPWYADHPTHADIQQEAYFLQVVVPFVEKTYPAQSTSSGRLLLGFSKSGWGAFSLLLRHPDRFGRAVAWDAPLMMDRPGRYGSGDIFGSEVNFERYRLSKLLTEQSERVRAGRRLVLLGYGNFRDHHLQAHALMERLKIEHDHQDGPPRKHDWHSGWVTEAAERLLSAR